MKNVFLRDGKPYARVRIDGKSKKVRCATVQEAKAMVSNLKLQRSVLRNGVGLGNIDWAAFKIRYLQYCQTDKKAETASCDERAFRMLDEAIYIKKLNQVTPELLEHLKFKWKEKGYSLASVTRHIKSLKTAMHRAEDWKYIPIQNWRIVKVQEPRGRLIYFTLDEFARLLSVCRGSWHTAALLMGRAGLRGGEAYHLEWSDIYFDMHKIHIQRKAFWQPKGKNGGKEHWVDLDADLEDYLLSIKKDSGFVLSEERMTFDSFKSYFGRLVRKAGLKGSAHTLRHTFASHLISNGASLSEVAGLLGVTEETAKIYAHLMPHATQNAIKKLPPIGTHLGHIKMQKGYLTVIDSNVTIDGNRARKA